MEATDGVAAAAGPPAGAGRRALREALRHVGVREQPPGSNRTPFGVWFGDDGQPWCAIFVSYCFAAGAGITLGRGWHGPGALPNGFAYVPSLERWLRDTGRWVVWPPRPGDIVVFDWDGGVADHCGIVERLDRTGLRTVEGNEGDAVARVRRGQTSVRGFGRI